MKTATVIVPAWTWKRINADRVKCGEVELSHVELEKREMAAAMESFESVCDGDALFLCVRKAMPDDDYKYGIACIPMAQTLDNILEVNLSQFGFDTTVITSNTKGSSIADVIRRVLKNFTFA